MEKGNINEVNLDFSDLPELLDQLGRTKRRIIIELYRSSIGYKKMAKTIGVGVDTIRSHIKSGKYSRSLLELGCVEKRDQGWVLTAKGLEIAENLMEDPTLKAFFYKDR
ncbi:MAG: hypothetical protein ACFFC7_20220 [Candidatus Hermodarchaeota archaeon]